MAVTGSFSARSVLETSLDQSQQSIRREIKNGSSGRMRRTLLVTSQNESSLRGRHNERRAGWTEQWRSQRKTRKMSPRERRKLGGHSAAIFSLKFDTEPTARRWCKNGKTRTEKRRMQSCVPGRNHETDVIRIRVNTDPEKPSGGGAWSHSGRVFDRWGQASRDRTIGNARRWFDAAPGPGAARRARQAADVRSVASRSEILTGTCRRVYRRFPPIRPIWVMLRYSAVSIPQPRFSAHRLSSPFLFSNQKLSFSAVITCWSIFFFGKTKWEKGPPRLDWRAKFQFRHFSNSLTAFRVLPVRCSSNALV